MYDSSFFGFFDPDGRPWGNSLDDYKSYENLVETSLKIAFLTQFKLPIPAGYFLDNVAVQRVFSKYSGNSKEAICFRELAKSCLVVAANESQIHADAVDDWNGIMNEWAIGDGSNRNRYVYLNCLPHEVAEKIQNSSDGGSYRRQLINSMCSINRIDYEGYLNGLNQLNLKRKELGNFDFDSIIRDKLLSGAEKFDLLESQVSDKLQSIASKTLDVGIRFSRSIVQNKKMCLDIGVSEEKLIERSEYEKISPILAHYHHYAFTKALGMESFVTSLSPEIDSNSGFGEIIHQIGGHHRVDGDKCKCFNLKDVSFEDIYKVRLGKEDHKFFDNLHKVHLSLSGDDVEEFADMNKNHYSHIKKIITHSQYNVPLQQIEKSLEGTVFSDEPTGAGLIALAKGGWAFVKEFGPNIKRRRQINSFFRAIDPPNKGLYRTSRRTQR